MLFYSHLTELLQIESIRPVRSVDLQDSTLLAEYIRVLNNLNLVVRKNDYPDIIRLCYSIHITE